MRVFIFTILLCLWYSGRGQEVLTLDSAKKILFENNINIKQSDLQRKITKISLQQAYDALIPNLSLNANNQHTMGLVFDQITGQLITGNQWSNTINTNISSGVVLFQGFKEFNIIKSGRLNLEIANLDIDKLKHELQLQLVGLFFQTLINRDLYQASVEQSRLSQQQLEAEEIKIEVGKSTLVDLAQAKNKVSNDDLNITNTKKAYELSLLKLKQLLEMDTGVAIDLQIPSLNVDDLSVSLTGGSSQDVYLSLLDKKIEQSKVNSAIARAGYYPTLTLNSSYGTNYSSRRFSSSFSSQVMPIWDQMNQNRSLYIGFGLSYPLFDRFATKRNVSKTQINTETLILELDKVKRDRKYIIEQARLEYWAALDEQKAVNAAMETNSINYQAMNERYNVGKSSSIDLFKAMTDFNVMEFRAITAKYNVLLKAELLKLQAGSD